MLLSVTLTCADGIQIRKSGEEDRGCCVGPQLTCATSSGTRGAHREGWGEGTSIHCHTAMPLSSSPRPPLSTNFHPKDMRQRHLEHTRGGSSSRCAGKAATYGSSPIPQPYGRAPLRRVLRLLPLTLCVYAHLVLCTRLRGGVQVAVATYSRVLHRPCDYVVA